MAPWDSIAKTPCPIWIEHNPSGLLHAVISWLAADNINDLWHKDYQRALQLLKSSFTSWLYLQSGSVAFESFAHKPWKSIFHTVLTPTQVLLVHWSMSVNSAIPLLRSALNKSCLLVFRPLTDCGLHEIILTLEKSWSSCLLTASTKNRYLVPHGFNW